MNEESKLMTPEEILGKPLNEMTEDDVLELATRFELDKVSEEKFREMDEQSRHDYVQRILDFFRITARKLVIGLFDLKTEARISTFQSKMSELKVKSPRPWSRVPKDRAEEFRLLEEAFEFWLERDPEVVDEPDAAEEAEALSYLSQCSPATDGFFDYRELFYPYETRNDRTAYSIAGNVTGNFTRKEIEEAAHFCFIRPFAWEKFLDFSPREQCYYLMTLVEFFRTTWDDLAIYWFKGDVSADELRKLANDLGARRRSRIISSRNIGEVIEACRLAGEHKEAGANNEEPDVEQVPESTPEEVEAPKPVFGKIDTFYSLRAELPKSAFYEIEAILRKYEDADAIRILQSSRSHLDTMSLEA